MKKIMTFILLGMSFYFAPLSAKEINDYRYQKIFKENDQLSIIYEIIGGGRRNGEETSLILAQAQKNHLRHSVLARGNRCLGGINNVHYHPHQLIYHMKLTPAALLNLSQKKSLRSQLDDCAVCCIGEAIYIRKAKTKFSIAILQGVKLNSSFSTENNRHTQQACFDKLLSFYQIKNKSMTPTEVKKLHQDFQKQCLF